MTAGRLPPASVAGQQTQIFHISAGRAPQQQRWISLLGWYFPQNHYKGQLSWVNDNRFFPPVEVLSCSRGLGCPLPLGKPRKGTRGF